MADKRDRGDDDDASNGNDVIKREKLDYGEAGTLLFSGATDFNTVGKKPTELASNLAQSPNTQWKPVRLAALDNIPIRNLSIGAVAFHFFAITDKGSVYGWGRNDKGQLGVGDCNGYCCPTLLTSLEGLNIVAIATGRSHSIFLTSEGEVYGCGDNRCGQVGIGKQHSTASTPKLIPFDGSPISKVACGAEFSAFVTSVGSVWTWGHPEYGQLGQNSDEGFLEKAGKVTHDFVYWPRQVVMYVERDTRTKLITHVTNVVVRDISCGNNHMVMVDQSNRVFTCGFGGYGRLGHSETADEKVPRLLKFFDGPRRGVSSVSAGGQFNIACGENPGQAFMWGQYNTRKEANMYPKPIQDLSGWSIRSMASSGKGWLVAADASVIAMSPSPCYGELAMGVFTKSSAKPIEITTLEGIHVLKVSLGVSQALFIARHSSDEDKKKLQSFSLLDQSDLDNMK